MTILPAFTVRIVTAAGDTIAIPCESLDAATEILDAAEVDGLHGYIVGIPSRAVALDTIAQMEE